MTPRSSPAPCAVTVLFLAALSVMPAMAADPAASGSFALSRDASPSLRLTEQPGEAPAGELHVLEIWADGRIRVQRPSYMKGSPRAESRLAPDELDEILAMLESRGVLDFDADASRARLKQARAAQFERARVDPSAVIMDATDPDSTSLEIRLDRTMPGDPRSQIRQDVRRIDWLGLRADARFFPECPELAGLAAAQAALWRLTDREGLR